MNPRLLILMLFDSYGEAVQIDYIGPCDAIVTDSAQATATVTDALC